MLSDAARLLERPIEPDTKIMNQRVVKLLGGFEVLAEEWNWEGVRAKSVVFISTGSVDIDLDIVEHIIAKFKIKGSYTKKRNGNYFFVNYGFVV
jgi:hypothetical protein